MKQKLLKLSILMLSLPFMAVVVDNPAPGFFVTRPGTTFQGILTFSIEMLLGIVGTLSVLFIIIGGFQYITSGGSGEAAENAKKTITNAAVGLIIVILSYVIVLAIINTLGARPF